MTEDTKPKIKEGQILQGRITEVRDFGAFVSLDGEQIGLVHISEISEDYIKDIHSVLRPNQTVKVKVSEIKDDDRIELSIKQAKGKDLSRQPRDPHEELAPQVYDPLSEPPEMEFEERDNSDGSFNQKMKKFKKQSSENLLDLKRSRENKLGGQND